MNVIDEFKNRQKLTELSFIEFLEAFARMSDMTSPPSVEDLEELLEAELGDDPTRVTYEFFRRLHDGALESLQSRIPFRNSRYENGSYQRKPTRPLAEKIQQMLEVTAGMLMDAFKVQGIANLIKFCNSKSQDHLHLT
eukprot:CAMPEP_0196576854 /NCGR_PEP_ID=MMETSP1081-20130531/6024_1 /TAXON_ID=36882 /ORGANISM="Pyramimonas amylifera, Strain CCMP720" /LENGTH=137 /DNA_ID=CAMNT_0041895573 /DNA_START=258 /DNA_END=671 /DNA_ORIENTATION=+